MRLGWLLPLVAIACKQDDGSEGLDKLVAELGTRFGAMLLAIDTDAPPCPSPLPQDGAVIMMLPSLVKIAGAVPIDSGDPNVRFTPTSYDSHVVGSYLNRYNPKRSTRKYASELLAAKTIVVTKIDKYTPAKVAAETFTPGTLDARTVVFDAATGKPACTVKFQARNSDKVWASSGAGSAESSLVDDLRRQFSLAGPSVKRY